MNFYQKYKIVSRLVSDKNVFRAINKNDDVDVLIKIEKLDKEILLLRHEAAIYTKLGKISGVLKMKWFGCHQSEFCYLVLPFIPNSLYDLIESSQLTGKAEIVTNIANQLINVLQEIHAKDIIHRDLKSENVMIDQNGKIYIIDFGFAKLYRRHGEHMPCTTIHDIIGTSEYISLNVHNKVSPSRRDDLTSLGYIVLEAYLGRLPWQDDNECCKMLKMKLLTKDLPKGSFLASIQHFLQYCNTLKFSETPEYTLL